MRKAVKPVGVYDIGRLASVDAWRPHGAPCAGVATFAAPSSDHGVVVIMRGDHGEQLFVYVLGRGEMGETLGGVMRETRNGMD